MQIVGSFAEFERAMLRERTKSEPSRTIRRIQSIHYLDRKDPEMQVHIL